MVIGVIGYGYWGPNLVRNLFQMDNIRLKSIVDIRKDRLEIVKSIYPQVITSENPDDIINDSEITAVLITTPVSSHFDLACCCLKQGKHVFLEKPMTTNLAEAEELSDLAEMVRKTLMIGHIFLYNDGIRFIKEAIDNKVLGNTLYLYFKRTGLGPVREDTDAIWDLAPHDISIALYLLGNLPLSITTHGKCYLQEKIADLGFMTLEFPGNIIVNIQISWIDPTKQRTFTIVGDRKMLVFDDIAITDKITIYDKGVSYQTKTGDFGEFQLAIRDGEIVKPNLKYNEPLKSQLMHFFDCIRTGNDPITSSRNGVDVMKVLDASKKSIESNNSKIYL